jgi:hydrogenase expression/formation protein HypE
VQGPAAGEDAAAISPPAGTLVISSDPISLAASHVGTLGVHVACNDVAVAGVDPRWLTAVVLLPDETDLESITADVDAAARDLGVAVVGGHTEYLDALDRPLVVLTAMGVGDFLPTSGANPGDAVLLTGGAGIEGTAILAADFGDALAVDDATVERIAAFLDDVSVVPAAKTLREYATAMHDPTEGGVLAGLDELSRAASVRIDVQRDAVPVRPETAALAAAGDVDPLRIFGSGAVLATVPQERVDDALDDAAAAGIEAAEIGTVRAGEASVVLDDARLETRVRDDLYDLWETGEAESTQ